MQRRVVEGAEGEVALAPAGAFFLVLTHDHALDLRITEAALRRADAGFVGVIGSKSKRERFRHRLAQRGLDEPRVDRMHCPVGVPGIGGFLDVVLRKWLKDNGVDTNKVQFVEIVLPQTGDALKSGSVDAVASVDPFFSRALETGAGVLAGDYMG